MNKFAKGCMIVVGVGVAGATAASYYAYHKINSAFTGFAQLGTLPEVERSVKNHAPFTPPASGEPSAAQVDRLLQVQQAVRTRLGTKAHEIERRYHDLLSKDSATVVDAPQLISAYRDLALAYMDAKRAQVEALNQAGLSMQEYRWTRQKVYGALGMPLMDFDVGRVVDDIKHGRQPDSTAFQMTVFPAGPDGSEDMKKLVEPHRKALEDNAGLAFFGL